jgi:hypothetical protein
MKPRLGGPTMTEDLLARLPEFPLETFESIGSLERSDHGPFLTIKPPRQATSRPTIPLPDVRKKASRMTQVHHAWVIYPIAVCYDPGPFVDGLQIAGPAPGGFGLGHPDDDLREVADRMEHYRLSSLAGRTFPRPLWCTVRYGPWYGTFKEQESCTEGDNDHMFDFYLEGVDPEQAPDVVTWIGGITDMPAVPSLSVIWGSLTSKTPRWSPCSEVGFSEPVGPPA